MRQATLSFLVLSIALGACSGDDDRPRADGGVPSTDGGPTLDAPRADAGRDAAVNDAHVTDTGVIPTDGGAIDPSQLLGVWEGVWIEDSGGPRETVPPGTFFVFEPDMTVRIGCGAPGLPYTLDVAAGTIVVEITGSSTITWRILELTATTFAFDEGGDHFGFERRATCG